MITRFLLLITLISLSGCSILAPTYLIPALDLGESNIVSVQGCCNNGEKVDFGYLDATQLVKYWKNAIWTNASQEILMSKGGQFDLVLNNGIVVIFNITHPVFQIRGVDGYYLIPKDQTEEYKDELVKSNQTIIENWNINLKPNHQLHRTP